MQIKVNEAQMQEYADYMDSIPAKLEAAGSAVQSVVSWMQNEEMLSEVSRGHYLTKLERVQQNLSDAATDAGRFGPAIRQIVTNYQQNERELTDELDSMVEEALARPTLSTAAVERAQNELAHNDLVTDDVDSSYRNTLIQTAKGTTKPEDLLSSGYMEQQGIISNLGVDTWALMHGDVRNAVDDPLTVQDCLMNNVLTSLLEESNGSVTLLAEESKDGKEHIYDMGTSTMAAVVDSSKNTILEKLLASGVPQENVADIISTFSQEKADVGVLEKMLGTTYKMSEADIGNVVEKLQKIEKAETIISKLSDAQTVADGAINIYNRLEMLSQIDKTKLADTAKIYMASSDANMQTVGKQLEILATGSTAAQMGVIAGTGALNTALSMAQDKIADAVKGQLSANPYALAAGCTMNVCDALGNLGDVASLRNKIEYSNMAAHQTYQVLQDCVAACEADPSAANMEQLKTAYETYHKAAAQSESAVADLYANSTKSFMGWLFTGNEVKGYPKLGKELAQAHLRGNANFEKMYVTYEKYGV